MAKITSFFFCFLALKGAFAFGSSNYSCLEILKNPLERDKFTLRKEIFEPGDQLIKEIFGHSSFAKLKIAQQREFYSQNKNKIIQNVIQQGTILEPVSNSSAFLVKGGLSRLGRVAKGLEKMGISVELDVERLLKKPASGFYSPQRSKIILGLEDVLYPNQLSYNLFHEIIHVSLESKSLFIPMIYDGLNQQNYRYFSLDEIFVYSKQIRLMLNEKVKEQNLASHETENSNADLVEAVRFYKELSLRTLRKKEELLKVIEYLRKVEKDPTILEEKDSSFFVEGLDPEIVLHKSAFYQYMPEMINDKLIADNPGANLRIFKGNREAYLDSLRDRAWASRLIIEDVLYFAESAFKK